MHADYPLGNILYAGNLKGQVGYGKMEVQMGLTETVFLMEAIPICLGTIKIG